MRKTAIFITFALIGTIFLGCSNQSKSSEAGSTDGPGYLKRLDFVKAEKAFSEMEEFESSAIYREYTEGFVFEHKLLYLDALDSYLKVIDLDPTFDDAYNGAYRCFRKLGSVEDALSIALENSKAPSVGVDAEVILAEALIANGDIGPARDYINQLTTVESSGLLKLLNGRLYLAEGNYDSADFYYNEGLSQTEPTAGLFNLAADYLVDLGLYDSAVVMSNQMIGLNTNDLYYLVPHFERLINLGYADQARTVLRLLKENKVDEFVTLWLELEAGFAADDYYIIRDKITKYVVKNSKLFNIKLRALEVRSYLVEELHAGQNYLALTNSTYPDSQSAAYIEYNNSYAAIRFSKFENSIRTRDNLVKIEGDRTKYRSYLMTLLTNSFRVGYFDESIEKADDYEKEYSDHYVWLSELGKFYTYPEIKKYSKAVRVLRAALDVNPTHTASFMKLLEGYEVQENYQGAIEEYESFQHFETANKYTSLYKSKLYLLNNEFDNFKSQFENNLAQNKGNTDFVSSLADILILRDNVDEIKYFIEKIKPISGGNSDLSVVVAELLLYTGEYQSSLSFVEQAAALVKENAAISILKARVEYYLGNIDEAFDLFEQNLKDYPNDPDNKYYYSRLLAKEGRDFGKASNIARGAVFETRDQAKYAVNLSYVYYRMGRFDLSMGEASKATKLKGYQTMVYYRLGMAWSHLSDREGYHLKAKDAFIKSIELGLSGEKLDEVKQLMKTL